MATPADRLVYLSSAAITALLTRLDALIADPTAVTDAPAVLRACRTELNNSLTCDNELDRFNRYRTERNTTQQRNQELETQLNEANTDLTDANAAINLLRTQLEQQTTIAHALAITRNVAPDERKTKDPETFAGDKDKFRSFCLQLKLKTSSWTDQQAKLRYAVGVLSGKALDQVASYILDDRVNLPDLPALINILAQTYDNPNRIADAEYSLRNIRQGSRTFSDYIAEFRRHVADVEWNENA